MVGRDGGGCGKKEARNPSTGDWFRKEVKNRRCGTLPLVTTSSGIANDVLRAPLVYVGWRV